MKNLLSKRSICTILAIPLILGMACQPVFSIEPAVEQEGADRVIDSAYPMPAYDERQNNAQNNVNIDNLIEENTISQDAEEAQDPVSTPADPEIMEGAVGVDSFVSEVALDILDTNDDGIVDSADSLFDLLRQNYLDDNQNERFTFTYSPSADGTPQDISGLLTDASKESLGMILLLMLRAFGPGSAFMYLSNDAMIEMFFGYDGVVTTVVSGSNWNVVVSYALSSSPVDDSTLHSIEETFEYVEDTDYVEPPGELELVPTGPIEEPHESYGPAIADAADNMQPNIKSTGPSNGFPRRKAQYGTFNKNGDASGKNVKFLSDKRSGEERDQNSSQEAYYYKVKDPGKNTYNKKSTIRRRVRINKQTSQVTRSDKDRAKIREARELPKDKGIDNDSELLIGSKWLEKKAALSDLFERVLTEEPGAVYLKEKESISAVILIAVAKDKKQDVYKGNNTEKE